jgi:hypothetical protein
MKNSLKERFTFKYSWGLYRDNISKTKAAVAQR